MKLDNITVEIRPRNSWEAIDIGFALARLWYPQLLLLWAATAFPTFLVVLGVGLLLPGKTTTWALVLFWLLKPFYEPPLIYWVSRAVFGERQSTRRILTRLYRRIAIHRLWSVGKSRLSIFRSFTLPPVLLEGLGSRKKNERLALLKQGQEVAALLTFGCYFIEFILAYTLLIVFYLLIPEELRWIDFGDFVFTPGTTLACVSYLLAAMVVAPLYVCGGFMMYISRRVDLEAWDLEIGFKRIRNRLGLRKTGKNLVVSVLLAFLCVQPVDSYGKNHGTYDRQQTKEIVTEVLQDKDFGQEVTRYRWVAKEKESKQADTAWMRAIRDFFTWLGELIDSLAKLLGGVATPVFQFLFWATIGGLVAYLLYRYAGLRKWLLRGRNSAETLRSHPQVMFGLDIHPESLPDDIAAACWEFLGTGKKRQCLSLLYRASLSRLVEKHQLDIEPSTTELECCSLVDDDREQEEAGFFKELTGVWVLAAYGHISPRTSTCERLIAGWRQFYG